MTASDPSAAETSDPGAFVISRDGDIIASLTVAYSLAGTADVAAVSSATIRAAANGTAKTVTLTINP